jgi:hypothetical protein
MKRFVRRFEREDEAGAKDRFKGAPWASLATAMAILVGGAAVVLMHRIAGPLRELTQATARIGHGTVDRGAQVVRDGGERQRPLLDQPVNAFLHGVEGPADPAGLVRADLGDAPLSPVFAYASTAWRTWTSAAPWPQTSTRCRQWSRRRSPTCAGTPTR